MARRRTRRSPSTRRAQPNAFDLAMQAIRDWFLEPLRGSARACRRRCSRCSSCSSSSALIVVGLLVFGLPRLRRRRRPRRRSSTTATGATSRRCAARPRPPPRPATGRSRSRSASGRSCAASSSATSCGCIPGTTARGFADAASAAFPRRDAALRTAAADFDGVRYLGQAGTRGRVRASHARSRSSSPATAPAGRRRRSADTGPAPHDGRAVTSPTRPPEARVTPRRRPRRSRPTVRARSSAATAPGS